MHPPPSYGATAQRPTWRDLPVPVRAVVEARLGGPVSSAVSAGSGFTRGFASVLATAGGQRIFVKASSIDYLVDAYRREAQITRALPAAVPAPRPRWTAIVDGWYVLALDPIDGHVPDLPWDPAELAATLSAWAVAAAALADLDLEVPHFADLTRDEFVTWREVVAHRAPLPAMPRYARGRLDELAELEQAMAALAGSGRGLMHGDLRPDNVLIDRSGAAWLCDWNHLCHGPAWFDTMSLLITAYASGLDAGALFHAHPTVRGLPDPGRALDAGLAALAGFLLSRASRPTDASPSVGPHRRWSGEVALRWLGARRGWSPRGGFGGSEHTW